MGTVLQQDVGRCHTPTRAWTCPTFTHRRVTFRGLMWNMTGGIAGSDAPDGLMSDLGSADSQGTRNRRREPLEPVCGPIRRGKPTNMLGSLDASPYRRPGTKYYGDGTGAVPATRSGPQRRGADPCGTEGLSYGQEPWTGKLTA